MNNNSVLSSLLRSPFGLYALGFIFSLGVYLLRWSDWFLEINYKVVVFLVITIIISLFLCFNCKWKIQRNCPPVSNVNCPPVSLSSNF